MFNDLAKATAFFEEIISKNEAAEPEQQVALAGANQHYKVAIAAMRIVMAEPLTAGRAQIMHIVMDEPDRLQKLHEVLKSEM